MQRFLTCISTVLGCAALFGCGGDDDGTRPTLPANTHQAIENYSAIVLASYQDSLSVAEELQDAVEAFVAAPSAATLEDARDAWLASREPYLQTEVYRFYGGPIDDDDGPEGLINAWPLDESHIDYVQGDDDAGIVNDPSVEIDADTLDDLNDPVDDTRVASGYHAIEFLLWGQDFDPEGPGDRPFTDYVTGEGGTAQNQDRRALYLTTATEVLVGHLEDLVAEWEEGEDNYREELHDTTDADALTRVLTGMRILSGFETGGERLLAALDTNNQEEEHSCFSDNTHRDMVQDVQGVQNVWLGSYDGLTAATTVSGTGIRDVVAAADAALAERVTDKIEESLSLANALQRPFDREIAADNPAGNARVEALGTALFELEELFGDVFRLFGLTVPPDPTP